MCVVFQPVRGPVGFSPGSSIPGHCVNFSWVRAQYPSAPLSLPKGGSMEPFAMAGPSGERQCPCPATLPCSPHSPCPSRVWEPCSFGRPGVYPELLRLPVGGEEWTGGQQPSLPQISSPPPARVGLLNKKIASIWWERFRPLLRDLCLGVPPSLTFPLL